MRILIVSALSPYPPNKGNKARTAALIGMLEKLGHEVWLFGLDFDSVAQEAARQALPGRCLFSLTGRRGVLHAFRRRFREICRYLETTPGVDSFWDYSWDADIQAMALDQKFDVVVANYFFFSRAFRFFPPSILKVIDQHDRFADRPRVLGVSRRHYNWYWTSHEREIEGLARADTIISIQKEEAAFFRKHLPGRCRIAVVGHPVPVEKMPRPKGGTPVIGYLASNSAQNFLNIRNFILEEWPRIQARLPEAKLAIAGGICQKLAGFPGIELWGEIENLRDFYGRTDVVVNPVLAGTGLKIKCVEALGFGRPLVTTPAGAEGIEGEGSRPFLVVGPDQGYADSIAKILKNPSYWEELSRDAYRFAIDWNEKCLRSLQEVFSCQNPVRASEEAVLSPTPNSFFSK